jgi:hypothetical protein
MLGSGLLHSPASAEEVGTDPAPAPAAAAEAQPFAADAAAAEVSPAFTYQGNLSRNGQPVNATCAFRFTLWDELSGGSRRGDPYSNTAVPVQGGVFTVLINFLNQFKGDELYQQTEVRCPGDADFITLAPRQLVAAVPYAIGLRPGAAMRSTASRDVFYAEIAAPDSIAIHGKATLQGSTAVFGESALWAGVWGQSDGASGVVGISRSTFSGGVYGTNTGRGYGVHGKAINGAGVFGESTAWYGVYGKSASQPGVVGESTNHDGVYGTASGPDRIGVKGVATAKGGVGVWGASNVATGVYGVTSEGNGVWGTSTKGSGVYGASASDSKLQAGVLGTSSDVVGTGVLGRGYIGVQGRSNGTRYSQGVLGDNDGSNTVGYAGYFNGLVYVAGNVVKGGGSFQIDHPLDPQNKYLSHSFVESPDMKNIYDGTVVLDAGGEAVVQLPEWFEALNRDFRYQLTPVGGYAPLYISQAVTQNQFKIAGGIPGLKVSWQVTGIRQDPYAEQNRIVVEQDKSPEERGKYLYPAAYGLPMSEGIAALHSGHQEAADSQAPGGQP